MSDRYRCVLIFGAPGVGKGTQGKLLGSVPGFLHVATGDLFRSLDMAGEEGRVFREYSSRGELVPDDFTLRLWRRHMRALIEQGRYTPARQMLILDGIPRSAAQAQAMTGDIDVLQILHLVAVDEDVLLGRMQRRAEREGRHDDADERVIRNRWSVYNRETLPVLEHYGRERCVQIDAVGSPGRVLLQILSAVVPVHERHFRNALEG